MRGGFGFLVGHICGPLNVIVCARTHEQVVWEGTFGLGGLVYVVVVGSIFLFV